MADKGKDRQDEIPKGVVTDKKKVDSTGIVDGASKGVPTDKKKVDPTGKLDKAKTALTEKKEQPRNRGRFAKEVDTIDKGSLRQSQRNLKKRIKPPGDLLSPIVKDVIVINEEDGEEDSESSSDEEVVRNSTITEDRPKEDATTAETIQHAPRQDDFENNRQQSGPSCNISSSAQQAFTRL